MIPSTLINLSTDFKYILLLTMAFVCLTDEVSIAKKTDISLPTYWYSKRCKNYLGQDSFYVEDYGYVECTLDTCPLAKDNTYLVPYCSYCCWANITGQYLRLKFFFSDCHYIFLSLK